MCYHRGVGGLYMGKKLIFITLAISLLCIPNGCAGSKSLIIKGSSMEPTIRNNENALVDYDFYKSNNIQRGDVVLVKFDEDQSSVAIKNIVTRVIALPSENIEIKNGKVYINGKELEEEYLPSGAKTTPLGKDVERWDIPDNKFFVLGDNRKPGASLDSRYFGAIPKDNIEGYIILKKK